MTIEEKEEIANLILGPIRDWAISMVPESGQCSTYGVDVAAKCAELVMQWPHVEGILQRINP